MSAKKLSYSEIVTILENMKCAGCNRKRASFGFLFELSTRLTIFFMRWDGMSDKFIIRELHELMSETCLEKKR